MALPRRTEELQGQERAEGMAGGEHLRSWHVGLVEDAVEGQRRQGGQEEEQAAELGVQWPGAEVEPAGVGDVGGARAGARWPFVVVAARQACKSSSLRIWS